MSEEKHYYIWSIEHQGWWVRTKRGYTGLLIYAGRFTEKDAKDICNQANVVKIEEVMIPVSSCH